MIAKLVARGATRDEARNALRSALDRTQLAPLRSNAGFLYACLGQPAFAEGSIDTGLIEREGEALLPPAVPSQAAIDAAARFYRDSAGDRPFATAAFGFRLNRPARDMVDKYIGRTHVVGVTGMTGRPAVSPVISSSDDGLLITERGCTYVARLRPPPPPPLGGAGATGNGAILAPMPGRVTAIHVAQGDKVTKGQKLVTMEAMKMEHGLTAPFDGEVAELDVTLGAQVGESAMLVRVTQADD
jgi:3-methylcrotonyl-CoA carboxylase alpha subunit